ncbi:MAG TPA: hypothetical protein VGS17_13090 [Candidatus Limnocylindria bacterium]|nr:hypothetical protein [Candidatus Limnocylindria bacterium]
MSGWRQLLLPDTAPLRESRSFRLLWIGQLISLSGGFAWSRCRQIFSGL